MGIYDRDYIRDVPAPWSGSEAFRWLTVWLMMIHGMALLAQTSPEVFADWAMAPAAVFEHREWWRPLSGIFVFGPNFLKVLLLAYFLWIFARPLEQSDGSPGLLILYLGAGVSANLIWGLSTYLWEMRGPWLFDPPMLTSCGAMAGVLAVSLWREARRPIFIFDLTLPAWPLALLFLAADIGFEGTLVTLLLPAPLGGAVFALTYQFLGTRWHRPKPRASGRFRAARMETLPPDDPPPAPAPPSTSPPAQTFQKDLESKLDAVLVKVHHSGVDSLNDEERRILHEASHRFRKRRT